MPNSPETSFADRRIRVDLLDRAAGRRCGSAGCGSPGRRAGRRRPSGQQAGEGAQQGRLAAGVRADHDGHRTGGDLHRAGRRPRSGRRRRGGGGRPASRVGRSHRWRERRSSGTVILRFRSGRLGRGARAGTGAPITAVTTPTGSSVGAKARRASRSAADHDRGPDQPGRDERRGSGRRTGAGRSGGRPRATKPTGPAAAVATAARPAAARASAGLGPVERDAQAGGRVVAHLHHPQLAGRHEDHREPAPRARGSAGGRSPSCGR